MSEQTTCRVCEQTCEEACSEHSPYVPCVDEQGVCDECQAGPVCVARCIRMDKWGSFCGYMVCGQCGARHRERCDREIAEANEHYYQQHGYLERAEDYADLV